MTAGAVRLAGQQYNVVVGRHRIGQRGLYRPRYVSERAFDAETIALELGTTVRANEKRDVRAALGEPATEVAANRPGA